MRILVVDDEPHLRRMMRLALEGAGYDVEEAADGDQALSVFGDGRRFAATLLDQRMPGLDGLEVLSRLKQRRADACVVMVTAYATIELAVDAMKLGATDFVRKPMTPETLRARSRRRAGQEQCASRRRACPPRQQSPRRASVRRRYRRSRFWTTNGFFVRRLGVTEEAGGLSHRFLVRQGRGESGVEIDVLIPAHTRADTARQAGCQPSAEFWRVQAESAVLNHLWANAAVPDGPSSSIVSPGRSSTRLWMPRGRDGVRVEERSQLARVFERCSAGRVVEHAPRIDVRGYRADGCGEPCDGRFVVTGPVFPGRPMQPEIDDPRPPAREVGAGCGRRVGRHARDAVSLQQPRGLYLEPARMTRLTDDGLIANRSGARRRTWQRAVLRRRATAATGPVAARVFHRVPLFQRGTAATVLSRGAASGRG